MSELPDYVLRNRAHWNGPAKRSTRTPGAATGPRNWGIWGCPSPTSACSLRMSRDSTRSSLAAAPATCPRGSPGAEPGRSASTTPRPSWPPRGNYSRSSGSSSRSCTAMPRRCPSWTDRLLRPYFGMHRFEWPDDDSVEFHLPHGEMIALLRDSGVRGGGPDRDQAARRIHDPVSVRAARLGETLALRGGVEGAKDRLSAIGAAAARRAARGPRRPRAIPSRARDAGSS
jgi:hypothetical protein